MQTIRSLTTSSTKARLLRVEDFDRTMSPVMIQFAGFLATRLSPKLRPDGFVTSCQLAIRDLAKGRNSRTGKVITHSLARKGNDFYIQIFRSIPALAKAVWPSDYAEEVCSFFNRLVAE